MYVPPVFISPSYTPFPHNIYYSTVYPKSIICTRSTTNKQTPTTFHLFAINIRYLKPLMQYGRLGSTP